ncbi:MAG: hypothetical protein LBR28_00315 [Bacteroidales bacterium]|jgi:beta-mannosidase|nr:hypothetical protein [Bacteroidales bacterium]
MKKYLSFFVVIIIYGVSLAQNVKFDTTFVADRSMLANKNVFLTIDRIKGLANIFVNEKHVMRTTNEFIPYSINIKSYLHKGENKINILFDSLFTDTNDYVARYNLLPNEPRVLYRMAQYNFGWDFAKANLNPEISGLRIVTSNEDNNLPFSYYVTTDTIKYDTAFLTLHTKDKKHHFQVAHPELWYPNGLGKPYLYNMKVDGKDIQFGIRTIRLIQEQDSAGQSFYFEVNGKPMFARGSNWIQLPETDTLLLMKVKEANMNMLRIWGGGRYVDEVFLTWCDRNGILVWQDFPFACALYPSDSKFIDEVKNEAEINLNRMKRHPSLALLCGNNENWEGIFNWGWKRQVKDSVLMKENYKKLFMEALPSVVEKVCPDIPYIHTSPLHGWGRKESLTHGDCHYWGVYHGDSCFETYTRKIGRFMSEYGFQSPFVLSSVFKGQYQMRFTSIKEMYARFQNQPQGFDKIDKMISDLYGGYEGNSDYFFKAHRIVCRAYRIAIEAHRRAKPYCMGSLSWQFNEPAPAFSWACIDGNGTPKPVYYTIKRAFEPVILSIDTYSSEDSVKIYYCNDMDITYNVQNINISFFDENENIIYTKILHNIPFDKNTSHCFVALALKDIPNFNSIKTFMKVSINQDDLQLYSYSFFCKPKDYIDSLLYDKIEFDYLQDKD